MVSQRKILNSDQQRAGSGYFVTTRRPQRPPHCRLYEINAHALQGSVVVGSFHVSIRFINKYTPASEGNKNYASRRLLAVSAVMNGFVEVNLLQLCCLETSLAVARLKSTRSLTRNTVELGWVCPGFRRVAEIEPLLRSLKAELNLRGRVRSRQEDNTQESCS